MLLVFLQYLFDVEQNDQLGIQLLPLAALPSENPSWRWFGKNTVSGEQSLRVQQDAEEILPEASINAELVGVVMTKNFSMATIRINGQQEKVFAIGDDLLLGVELLNVGTSKVVLRERGREVQITMKRPDEIPIELRNQVNTNFSNTAVLQSGFSLTNMFDALPVQLENSATGIQLGGISEEILSLSEFQDGDVVIQVGLTSIDELMSNPGQWMSYSTETFLPVTVMRNGQETTINVNAFSLSARILPNLTSELMQ